MSYAWCRMDKSVEVLSHYEWRDRSANRIRDCAVGASVSAVANAAVQPLEIYRLH